MMTEAKKPMYTIEKVNERIEYWMDVLASLPLDKDPKLPEYVQRRIDFWTGYKEKYHTVLYQEYQDRKQREYLDKLNEDRAKMNLSKKQVLQKQAEILYYCTINNEYKTELLVEHFTDFPVPLIEDAVAAYKKQRYFLVRSLNMPDEFFLISKLDNSQIKFRLWGTKMLYSPKKLDEFEKEFIEFMGFKHSTIKK